MSYEAALQKAMGSKFIKDVHVPAPDSDPSPSTPSEPDNKLEAAEKGSGAPSDSAHGGTAFHAPA